MQNRYVTMKIISKQISTFFASIFSTLLSILGFSSCTDNEVMYGMPFGSFDIKGSVTDDNGTPVSDAEIRVTFMDMPSGVFSIASTRTLPEGTYNLKGSEWASKLKIVCIPYQSDLQPDSVIVDMKYKGDDGEWYKGHAESTVDFILKDNNKSPQ